MSLYDEIWAELPAERALDEAAVQFALGVAHSVASAAESGARALDLGCGDGAITARLAETGLAATGVDPSQVALERARARHPDLELAAPLGDGRLPFADSSFEAVFCIHVLQHVADTQMLMSEVRRVLVPGGTIAIVVPWHGRLKNVLIAVGSFERHHDPLEPVVRHYTRRSLESLLLSFGFDDVRLRGAGGLPLARSTLLARALRCAP